MKMQKHSKLFYHGGLHIICKKHTLLYISYFWGINVAEGFRWGPLSWRSKRPAYHTVHVHQKKFADQTVACFPIGPRALIGSQGLCWRITLPNSTSPSLFVLQPWLQRFRGAAGTQESQKVGPSKDNINTRKASPWRRDNIGGTSWF